MPGSLGNRLPQEPWQLSAAPRSFTLEPAENGDTEPAIKHTTFRENPNRPVAGTLRNRSENPGNQLMVLRLFQG